MLILHALSLGSLRLPHALHNGLVSVICQGLVIKDCRHIWRKWKQNCQHLRKCVCI